LDRQTLKDYSIIGSAVITAILVAAILTQTIILKEDFEANTRPWIAVSNVNFTNNQLFYYYSNYGLIPNLTGELKSGGSKNEITREELDKISEPGQMNVVLPTREIKHRMSDGVNQLLLDSVQEGNDFYLGILLEYEFEGNRKGLYGIIYKLNIENKAFDIIDSWAK